jgi:hypothetical protein
VKEGRREGVREGRGGCAAVLVSTTSSSSSSSSASNFCALHHTYIHTFTYIFSLLPPPLVERGGPGEARRGRQEHPPL